MSFKQISNNKLYSVYVDDLNNYIIKGRSAIGNDYIISNADNILFTDYDIKTYNEDLIWLHGDGPSPHFILYKSINSINCSDIDKFIKSECPNKSNKNKKLSCCLLSDIKKTKTIGMVTIKNTELSKLLK
jgi:hypothetical protein